MTLEQLKAAFDAAVKRGKEMRDELEAADPADKNLDIPVLEQELEDATAEVQRTRENLNKAIERNKILDADPVDVPGKKEPLQARGSLRSELTYRPDAGHSFFADIRAMKDGDQEARERMLRNNREYEVEKRAGVNQTATSGGEFIPPVWAIDQYAAKLRAGRPTVSAIGTKPWPMGTNSLNFPAITTGSTTAAQVDGAAVSNTDLVTSSYTAQAQTVAGKTVTSYQLIDLGWAGVDGIIYDDLVADFARQFDVLVVNGAVTNAKGLLNVTGVNAVTFTSAAPKPVSATVADSFYYQHFLAKNAIEKNAFAPADLAILHPSEWNWFLTGLDSQTRPLGIALTGASGFNALGQFDPNDVPSAPTIAGNIAGLGIVVDANVPVNLGGGTNESRYIMLNRRGFDIYETQPVFKIADQTSIGTLQYQFVLYGYYGVVSRQPKMISVVSGTGMIVQSGV